MTLPPEPPLLPLLPQPEGPLALEDGKLDIRPTFNHMELNIEPYIKSQLGLKLDTDAQLCRDFLSPEGCPRGSKCLLRHVTPSAKNFRPPSPMQSSAHSRTVCKHWLRGLCKKGPACEFLHEFNLRKMPECWFYATNGYCVSGDECMYLHVGAKERRPECRAFVQGFCVKGRSLRTSKLPVKYANADFNEKGPECPYKHIRRVACPLYMTGFCPRGQDCQYTHPPYEVSELERVLDPEFLKKRKEASLGLYSNRDRDWPEEFGGRGSGAVGSGAPGMQDRGGGGGRGKRDLSEVLCFKVSSLCFSRSMKAN